MTDKKKRILTGDRGLFAEALRFPVSRFTPWSLPLVPTGATWRVLAAETERGRLSLFDGGAAGPVRRDAWSLGTTVGDPLRADLDADGIVELIVPVPALSELRIVEPFGEGWLLPRVWPVGAGPKRLLLDVRDDQVRAVILCTNALEVWVQSLGRATVTTEQVVDLPLAVDPDEIALADLDGLNGRDLFVLDVVRGVDVALAGPDGSFGPLQTLVAVSGAQDFAVANVRGDDRPEIVVTSGTLPGVIVYAETGPGVWTQVDERVLGESPVVLAARDLDLNGYDDVVALGRQSRAFLVFTGADGIAAVSEFVAGREPRDVAFGEFDRDAWPDVVIASPTSRTFTVLSSETAGLYKTTVSAGEAPRGAQNVAVDDVNGDGLDDIVLSSLVDAYATIHLGAASGGQFLPGPSEVRVNEQPGDVRLVELDGDGTPEIVTIDRRSDQIVVVRSDPFADLVPITGSIAATRQGTAVRIDVASTARAVEQLAVRRALDDRPVLLRSDGEGRWTGLDPVPPASAASYVLYDQQGVELDRAATDDDGGATSVESPSVARILPPSMDDGIVTIRFRTGGNRAPAVDVYDLRGRAVGSLDAVPADGGWFEAHWAGRDARGRAIARGRYLVRIHGPDGTMTTPVTLR